MENNKRKIVLLGGGGHALSVSDAILSMGCFEICGYTDVTDANNHINYLGTDDVLPKIYDCGIQNAAICVGYLGRSKLRDKLYALVQRIGFALPPIIDKSAVVSKSAEIGDGTFVGKGVIINADTKVGKMCIINSGAILEHNNLIDDFSHISVGTTLCGDVMVGHHSFIGANATVIQGVKIGMNAIVGAGSLVLGNVEQDTTCFGIISSIE